MKNLISATLVILGLSLGTNAVNATCTPVGDVISMFNAGSMSMVQTSEGMFTFSGPMAIKTISNSGDRHAPACYNARTNKLTYTLPGGGKRSRVVK